MNDQDDYDFSSSKKSILPSLFGKENSQEFGSTSLIYKPQKQPTANEVNDRKTSTLSKSYYKYINLYEVTSENKQSFGKYVLALVRSEANPSLILIYQTKSNILIRKHISDKSIYSSPESDNCLNLLASEKEWLLEFLKESDYKEFCAEFSKFGGIIEYPPVGLTKTISGRTGFPVLQASSLVSNLKESQALSSILDPIQVPNESTNGIVDNDYINDESRGKINTGTDKASELKEKEDILARLAKMGLPQLPSFENDEICSNKIVKTIAEKHKGSDDNDSRQNSTNEEKKISSTEHKSDRVQIKNEIIPVASNTLAHDIGPTNYSTTQSFNQLQMLNGTGGQIDQLSIMLAESRINNSEIRHYITTLAKEIKDLLKPKESGEGHMQDQLSSKLRAFQLKAENLEAELNRSKRNYQKLQKVNNELSSIIESSKSSKPTVEMIDISSQTEEVELNNETTNSGYKSQLIELLNIFKCTQLKTGIDIEIFKNIQKQIEDEELIDCFESTINTIEEMRDKEKNDIDNDHVERRNSFIKETKKIMSDMYSNICLSFDEECDNKNTVATQIRNVTSEIVKNYDKSIENNFMK